ncbi:hypothetical protein FGB62_364g01 [Gracilaria domingensis]|nr:hypothetical protein FGB62_364g01 [Gracilaria domingensis]
MVSVGDINITSKSVCCPDSVCPGTVLETLCVKRTYVGHRCRYDSFSACLRIVHGRRQRPTTPVGGSCMAAGSVCVPGSVCVGTARQKICVTPERVGGRSGQDPCSACAEDLQCDNGRCRDRKIPVGGNLRTLDSVYIPSAGPAGTAMKKLPMKSKSTKSCCGKKPFRAFRSSLYWMRRRCRERNISLGENGSASRSFGIRGNVCADTEQRKQCTLRTPVGYRCGHNQFTVWRKDLNKARRPLCEHEAVCAKNTLLKKGVFPRQRGFHYNRDLYVCAQGLIYENGICRTPLHRDCTGQGSVRVDGTVCAGTIQSKQCVRPMRARLRCGRDPFRVCDRGHTCQKGLCKARTGSSGTSNTKGTHETPCASCHGKEKCVVPMSAGKPYGWNAFWVLAKVYYAAEGYAEYVREEITFQTAPVPVEKGQRCVNTEPFVRCKVICLVTLRLIIMP